MTTRYSELSDADLQQSLDMATHIARLARQNGDQQREDDFHADLDEMLTEARERGWDDTSGGWLRPEN